MKIEEIAAALQVADSKSDQANSLFHAAPLSPRRLCAKRRCQSVHQSECGYQTPHLKHCGSAHWVNASWIAIRDSTPFL
jgi:hypothetical protein